MERLFRPPPNLKGFNISNINIFDFINKCTNREGITDIYFKMETITYLLGAGASAECLPVVEGMGKAIHAMKSMFDTRYKTDASINANTDVIFKNITADLDWLSKICTSNSSVDTYAKKLFLDDDTKQYTRLKNALSIYFTLAQKFPPEWASDIHFDRRYDNFWASILNRGQPIPKNLRIISWNYDSQLELSYSTFFKESLNNAYSKLNMLSFHDNPTNFQTDKFGIFKLNGSAKLISHLGYKSSYISSELIGGKNHRQFFDDLFKSYNTLLPDDMKTAQESYKSQLSFAWEHDELTNDYYSKLEESIKETTILVVIGYSFPFFNRSIDKRLIKGYMKRLRKVYFQGKEPESLKERFLAITDRIPDNNLLLRYDVKQFAFPNELDI